MLVAGRNGLVARGVGEMFADVTDQGIMRAQMGLMDIDSIW